MTQHFLHSQIRRPIRNKGHFPSDEAATKGIYLISLSIAAMWTWARRSVLPEPAWPANPTSAVSPPKMMTPTRTHNSEQAPASLLGQPVLSCIADRYFRQLCGRYATRDLLPMGLGLPPRSRRGVVFPQQHALHHSSDQRDGGAELSTLT